jgi:hypothetical protein
MGSVYITSGMPTNYGRVRSRRTERPLNCPRQVKGQFKPREEMVGTQ